MERDGDFLSTTAVGRGFPGHRERVSRGERAVDVMVAREALAAVAASQGEALIESGPEAEAN